MSFHPDVEAAFAVASTQSGEITIAQLVKVLTESAVQSLAPYLVLAEVLVADEDGDNDEVGHEERGDRDYHAEESTTGKTIKKFCVNMLEMAANGKYHQVIGREDELDRILLILARSTKNNPVLVGAPGTGKTAIAEGLAIRLLKRQVPPALQDLKLYSLDYPTIKSLPDSVGMMKSLLEEAAADPNLVLFIDEIHMLISNSSYSDNDIANLLKPAMANGDIIQ